MAILRDRITIIETHPLKLHEKITIIRIGNEAKKFDAVKIFKNYYAKQAKAQKELEEKTEKIRTQKAQEFIDVKENGTKTKSGLVYKIITKG